MRGSSLRPATLALAALGAAVAGYLTYVHYAGLSPLCLAGSGGCERVQTSDYAQLLGVPVALLGLVTYALIGLASFLGGSAGRLAAALLAVGAAAFSAYLTYLELFVIDAICQWCVASAVIATLLAAAGCGRYLQGDEEPAGTEPRRLGRLEPRDRVSV